MTGANPPTDVRPVPVGSIEITEAQRRQAALRAAENTTSRGFDADTERADLFDLLDALDLLDATGEAP